MSFDLTGFRSGKNGGIPGSHASSHEASGSDKVTVLGGQKDVQTTLTPTNGSTVTLDYSLGNAFYINASGLGTGQSFTIATSNWPSSSYVSGITLIILTGGTLPTINWPSGWTAPTLLASKETWFSASSRNGATTTRLFKAGEF